MVLPCAFYRPWGRYHHPHIFGERDTLVEGVMPLGILPPIKHGVYRNGRNGMAHRRKRQHARPTLKQWQTLAAGFPAMETAKQLHTITGFFNGWRQIPDSENYGKDEY